MTLAQSIRCVFLGYDSSSTHNFMDSEAAARVGIKFSNRAGFSVAVANRDRVASSGSYTDLKINITGEPFIIACYGLSLCSYEMILDVHWFESLGLVLWDFTHRTLSFCRDGRKIHWSAFVPLEPLGPTVAAVSDDVLGDLLLRFEPLFAEPSGLSPQRHRCHQIWLVPGTPPVAVHPYRYAHHQKQELEQQCATMLRQGVIHASSSVFAAPVLLVKKSDGPWRFCVDYPALNAVTIKDKFPIPVVKELLDKLRGAKFFSKLDLPSSYHQVRMDPNDVHKTAFHTHEGLLSS
jgi:hypothetical protein